MRLTSCNRWTAIALVAALPLAACSGDTKQSTEQISRPDHAEVFTPSDGVVRQLATVDYLALGTIGELRDMGETPGTSIASVRFDSVYWWAESRWSAGTEIGVRPPKDAEQRTLLVDDAWSVEPGSSYVIGVSDHVSIEGTDGYIQIVSAPGSLPEVPNEAAREPSDKASEVASFVAAAAQQRGPGSAPNDVVLELVADARSWIDERNRHPDEETPPGGLAGEVLAAVEPPASSRSAVDDFMESNPELRQLPQRLDEMPGLADRVGLPLAPSSFAIFTEDRELEFVGLRFPQVGIVGPWNLDHQAGYSRLFGVAPTAGRVEILGWSTSDPQPDELTEIGAFSFPPRWDPATEVLVITLGTEAVVVVEAMHVASFSQMIEEMARSRGALPTTDGENSPTDPER